MNDELVIDTFEGIFLESENLKTVSSHPVALLESKVLFSIFKLAAVESSTI